MRYDFVPSMQDSKRSTTTDTILPKPKEIGVRKTLPVRRGTSCVAVPVRCLIVITYISGGSGDILFLSMLFLSAKERGAKLKKERATRVA